MRILLVTRKFPPHAHGGAEIYAYHLAQALRVRHKVAVFYRHDDANAGDGPSWAEYDEDTDGIPTRRVSSPPSGLGASVAGEFFHTFLNRRIEVSFDRFVAQFQPDLIHVQQVSALSARLLPLARQAGVPLVLTLHDYWFECNNSQLLWPDGRPCQGKAWGLNCVRCAAAARFPVPLATLLRPILAPLFLYRNHVVRRAALQADQFVAPSRFLRDEYAAAGLPVDRLLYLENGIPLDRIRRFPRQPSTGTLRIAFIGALAWHKGVHVLAEAFRGLVPGTARLRIWGDPAQFPDYVQEVRQLLSDSNGELMGPIANERVGEALADSDVLVVPSLWYENSPVVIQEAWTAGVPVVASGHGALAEKVHDGVDGLHFAPGDAPALRQVLQRLVDEPDLLPRLRAGIQSPLDITAHTRQLEAIYERLLVARETA